MISHFSSSSIKYFYQCCKK